MTEKTVLVTGASGLIGKELCLKLLKEGHRLIVTTRKQKKQFQEEFQLPCEVVTWENPTAEIPNFTSINTIDWVIHLMGEPIANKRWSNEQKEELKKSRVKSSYNLVQALQNKNVKVFASASAIGIYQKISNKTLTEKSPLPNYSKNQNEFLSELCQDWEKASQLPTPTRNIQLRFGIVLSLNGGALPKMAKPFELGVGGPIQSNTPLWTSWVHIEDAVQSILFTLNNEGMSGPVNVVAPNPVTNKVFSKTLAHSLKTWSYLPVPALALETIFGEMAEVLLSSQKVHPSVLLKNGFQFQFPSIEQAFENLYHWKSKSSDHLFTQIQFIPNKTIQDVFTFFCEANNLEKITPPFLNFKITQQSTPNIQEGSIIDYNLKIHGVPAKWKTLISQWNPPYSFQDEQVSGPYAKWEHLHTFIELKEGVLMKDTVSYRLPLSTFGGGLLKPLILRDIQKIFEFRRQYIEKNFIV